MDNWPTMDSSVILPLANTGILHSPSNSDSGEFDPYQTMLKKKKLSVNDDSNYIDPQIQKYDTRDIQELEKFCQQHGITGFNFGKMHPKSALKMLKNKMGVINENNNIKNMLFG